MVPLARGCPGTRPRTRVGLRTRVRPAVQRSARPRRVTSHRVRELAARGVQRGMAIIHSTATLSPTELELLSSWLPAQPWYLDHGRQPELARAGGFRLDDPRGEVGIEFMVVTDG